MKSMYETLLDEARAVREANKAKLLSTAEAAVQGKSPVLWRLMLEAKEVEIYHEDNKCDICPTGQVYWRISIRVILYARCSDSDPVIGLRTANCDHCLDLSREGVARFLLRNS